MFGCLVLLVMLLAFIVASSGGLGSAKTKWIGVILVLGRLQAFSGVSPSVPALGFLRGIHALAI